MAMVEYHPSVKARFIGAALSLGFAAMVTVAAWYVTQARQLAWQTAMEERQAMIDAKDVELLTKQRDLEALKQEHDALLLLYDSAYIGYAEFDSQGLVTEWNPTLEKWTGYSKEEMLGQDLQRLMSEQANTKHEVSYAAIMADPKAINRTYEIEHELLPRKPDKKPVRVKIVAMALKAPSGESYAISLVYRVSRIVELSKE